VAGLLAAGVALASVVSACDSIDPTAQAFSIGFRNDTQKPLVLRACDGDGCDELGDTWRLRPGETARDNISDRGSVTWWRVFDQRGHSLGCLPMAFGAKYDDVVVRLSQRQPCASTRPITANQVTHGKKHRRE
jgi:hypothetical protein